MSVAGSRRIAPTRTPKVRLYDMRARIACLYGWRMISTPNAVYIHWAVVAPHNNKQLIDEPKFIGVGGHLFAIAIDKSYDWNHNGVVYGFASNEKVLKHYIEKLSETTWDYYININLQLWKMKPKR